MTSTLKIAAKLREGCEDELLTINAPDRRAVSSTDPSAGQHNRYRRPDRQTFAQGANLVLEFQIALLAAVLALCQSTCIKSCLGRRAEKNVYFRSFETKKSFFDLQSVEWTVEITNMSREEQNRASI